jgi:Domain of unknown function (DUF1905)
MTASAFNAVIKVRGVNPFVSVSGFRANALRAGWRKPLPVLVRINGKPANACRTNMMPVGDGSFYLYLHGEIRKASGTTVGDRVRVEIDFDASYRNARSTPCPGGLDLLSVEHRKLGRIGSLSSRAARRRSFATSHASIRRTLVPGI